jgi:Zn-dependent protease with chaperone function
MTPVSKVLIGIGISLILLGLFWQFAGRFMHLGRLPGDIAVERENFRFYFPIATSIILSIIFSGVMYLVRYFSKR